MLNPLLTSSSPNYDLRAGFNILSNLLKEAGESSSSTLAESIKTEVERVAGFALTAGTDLTIESSKISLKVSTLDTSAEINYVPSTTSTIAVKFPINFVATGSKLVSIVYKDTIDQIAATSSAHRQVTDSLTLKAYSGTTELPVTGLSTEIELAFPVSSSEPAIATILSEVASSTRALTHVECSFFNEGTKQAD